MIPYMGRRLFSWIKFPFVLVSDIAGKVVAVGSGVTGLRVGDRVLAMAAGAAKQRNRAAEGAFQIYTIVLPRLATVIPDNVSYEEAAVLPLGVTTAACGLFQKDLLALELPTANRTARDEWVIIWGGSTSVGSNAIQLAAAAGYGVVTTASPKNFSYVKSIGAAQVFDYNSRTVVREVRAALKGKRVVGALSIGAGSAPRCLDILAHCDGRKFVASCSVPVSLEAMSRGPRATLPVLMRALPALILANLRTRRKSRRYGIAEKFFDASSVIDNEIGPAIYQDYLGRALASGSFRPAPPPRVVGNSLDDIQKALDIQRSGVSASKIVVTLP
jgi:NADPH:quinone reductase-like Zn-dependent oxidoreductase